MKTRRNRKQPNAPKTEEKPFFSKKGSEPGVQTKEEGFFQPKLTIGQPGDRYEQEADRVADAVVNHTRSNANEATAIRKKGKLQRQEEEEEAQAKLQRQEEEEEAQTKLQRQPMEEEEEMMQPKLQLQEEEEEAQPKLQRQEEEEEAQTKLQRQEEEEAQAKLQRQEEEEEPVQAQSRNKQARPALAQRLAESKGQGRPLPPKVQDKMEAALDTDFSGVRIHTDQEAVQMSQELGAQAFTRGQDIYFNEGKFNPANSDGEHLLAHELTHVVQQGKK